jgi:fructose-1,6-bisphosphatase I
MITLGEYLEESGCEQELQVLIDLIARQAIPIRRAFISNQQYAASVNVSGERQAAMDTWADEHIIEVLKGSGLVREIASEEQDDIITCPDAAAEYSVVMDPLDGSSLIQVNLAVGTIVGIYDHGGVLQKGANLRAAFYMLYGPMTVLTLTVGKGVFIFALNEEDEYILLEGQVAMPEGKIYASGGLKRDWTLQHARFIDYVEREGFKLRYSGSYVADFHNVLKYGGFYCYPALREKKEGKLRLLFEAYPIGFIAQQAGGAISNGMENLLEQEPVRVHQRTPIYVGSKGLIKRLEEMMNR